LGDVTHDHLASENKQVDKDEHLEEPVEGLWRVAGEGVISGEVPCHITRAQAHAPCPREKPILSQSYMVNGIRSIGREG